jgi:fructose-1,6-bisphosphatase I
MLFECLPLGWLITVAGGAAISDTEDLLDQVPTDLHSRTGIALGSKNVVAEILEFNKKFPISESINPEKPQ